MTVSSDDELTALKLIGRIVADALATMGKAIEPGMTTRELDAIGRRVMEEGLVFTVEPFLSLGATFAEDGDDPWTLYSQPNALTVQYEHTVVATRNGPLILSMPSQ